MKYIIGIMIFVFLSGCLLTRNEIKQSKEQDLLKNQVGNLQKNNADEKAKLDEMEFQYRELVGRSEVLEKSYADLKQAYETQLRLQNDTYNDRFKSYEQALKGLETQVVRLNGEVARLQQQILKTKKAKLKKTLVPKGNYTSAEYYFSKKKWDKAIENYDKYRKANPRGRRFSTATYKIGVSFQNLGMGNEAKAFFSEVISKYPKTKEAKRSKARLSKIK